MKNPLLSFNHLMTCKKIKYLSRVLTDGLTDDRDINRQCCEPFVSANMLLYKFNICYLMSNVSVHLKCNHAVGPLCLHMSQCQSLVCLFRCSVRMYG